MLLILSFSLIFFFFLTFCLLPSFCRNFCFNYVILVLPSKWHPFLLMQKLLSPWYINLQLGFNFEMFLHFMHYLSLDFFSWFVYLSSFLSSGDFLHMFPDPCDYSYLKTRPSNFDWKLCDLWCLQWVLLTLVKLVWMMASHSGLKYPCKDINLWNLLISPEKNSPSFYMGLPIGF